MNTLELLAPAGNAAIGLAAINCGADAVYIGAPRFGAREAAGNSVSDIAALTRYAHRYNARVYIALNTILSDEEIPYAVRLAEQLWEAGADALIIQDMGLLEAGLPPIPLTLSTQGNCDTPEKAVFYEKCGFKRIILPREMSLAGIKAVRAAVSCELEFFVHGALCVSQSGQCYLSHALGGRSGNRGRCAQPCRKAYVCTDSDGNTVDVGKYPLSLRDFNLSKRLNSLYLAGITSFKIEGRLKDENYVKNVVSAYRAELDRILAKHSIPAASDGLAIPGFTPDLSKTFNRGYTMYFLDGNPKDIAANDTPKFKGELLGTAYEVREGSFKVKDSGKLHPGDGLAWHDRFGNLKGSLVNGVKDSRVRMESMVGIENGTRIYRNYDRLFIQGISKARSERKFRVRMEFRDYSGGFIISAEDELGRKAEKKVPTVKSSARNPVQAEETIRKQLCKTGESPFVVEKLEINMSAPYFLPVSILNDLRREILSRLAAEEPEYVRRETKIRKTRHSFPVKKLDYRGNVMNSLAAAFYKRHGVREIGKAAELGADIDGMPLMRIRHCLRRQAGLCRKGKDTSPFFLESENGDRLRIEFRCDECVNEVFLEAKGHSDEENKNENKGRTERKRR